MIAIALHNTGMPDGGILSGQSCCNMAIVIAVKTSYMGAISCHVSQFFTLETFIFIARHGIY